MEIPAIHTLSLAQVGLANADNTADTAKPISVLQQAGWIPRLILVHTHVAANITDFTAAVDARVQNIVGAAPGALTRLMKLANALVTMQFASTVTTNLAVKRP